MPQENCIFCKIAAGEIPSATIYEDEVCRVILDIAPAAKGHAILLPKKHFANIFEIDKETAGSVLYTASRVASEQRACSGTERIPPAYSHHSKI